MIPASNEATHQGNKRDASKYLYDHPAGDKEDLGEGMGSRVVRFSEQQPAAVSSSSQQQQQSAAGASNVSINRGKH